MDEYDKDEKMEDISKPIKAVKVCCFEFEV